MDAVTYFWCIINAGLFFTNKGCWKIKTNLLPRATGIRVYSELISDKRVLIFQQHITSWQRCGVRFNDWWNIARKYYIGISVWYVEYVMIWKLV